MADQTSVNLTELGSAWLIHGSHAQISERPIEFKLQQWGFQIRENRLWVNSITKPHPKPFIQKNKMFLPLPKNTKKVDQFFSGVNTAF